MKFSDLDPIQRLCTFLHMSEEAEAIDRQSLFERLTPLRQQVTSLSDTLSDGRLKRQLVAVLATMHAVDRIFEQDCGFTRHVYLLGDDAVLQANPEIAALQTDLSPCLELLSSLGLIYRFNVAPKFGIERRTTVQLRLNGWGRDLVERFGDIQAPEHLSRLDYVRTLVRSARQLYVELLALCDAQSRPLDVLQIREIHSSLPFKVVT